MKDGFDTQRCRPIFDWWVSIFTTPRSPSDIIAAGVVAKVAGSQGTVRLAIRVPHSVGGVHLITLAQAHDALVLGLHLCHDYVAALMRISAGMQG